MRPTIPGPYDDTGWAIPLVRNVTAKAVADKAILQQPMTLAAADFKVPARSPAPARCCSSITRPTTRW
jgi:hypothetical protein